MTFNQPLWLSAAGIILPLAYLAWRKERVLVARACSSRSSSGSIALSHAGFALIAISLALTAVALAQPQVPVNDQSLSKLPGRDIIFALDYSSSMGLPYKGEKAALPLNPWLPNATRDGVVLPAHEFRRIDAAQDAILSFVEWRRRLSDGGHGGASPSAKSVEGNGGDAVGLIVFDRRPILRWPLDHDLRQITRHGSFVPQGKGWQGLGVGTNFGREIPGPIDMAAEQFQKRGQSSTRVLVLVTDGEDELEARVVARLAKVIRDAHIKLYVIGIGDKIGKEKLDIEKLCEQVGGKIFRADTKERLDTCFQEINSLESSQVPVYNFKSLETVFSGFLSLALVAFLLGVVTEAFILGR